MATLCLVCMKPSTRKCSRCLAVRYCSRECQEKDWESHQEICKHVKKDGTFKNLQKAKFNCFVCGKVGVFLRRLPCCGTHIHENCSSGGKCPKCGKWCGFFGGDKPVRGEYPTEFREKLENQMIDISFQLGKRGLTHEESEVVFTMINAIGFVFQSHYEGEKTAQEEDAFICDLLEAPRAVERLIVISRIFTDKLQKEAFFPEQFARAISDFMLTGVDKNRKSLRASFLVHSLKWFNTQIMFGPSIEAMFKNPDLCFLAFASTCVWRDKDGETRARILAEMDSSSIAVQNIVSEAVKGGKPLLDEAMSLAIFHKMRNLCLSLAEVSDRF